MYEEGDAAVRGGKIVLSAGRGEPVRLASYALGTQTAPCRLGLLFALAWEKMALFLTFMKGAFFRTPRRRCLTPGRAEFSRHAEERPFCKRLETAHFRGGHGERMAVLERNHGRQGAV